MSNQPSPRSPWLLWLALFAALPALTLPLPGHAVPSAVEGSRAPRNVGGEGPRLTARGADPIPSVGEGSRTPRIAGGEGARLAAEDATGRDDGWSSLPSYAGASSDDAARDRFDSLRRRIEQRIAEPGVAADLYELMELVGETGSLERAADLLYAVVQSGRAHPEVRALARRQAATVERWRGRLPRMKTNLAALGTVTSLSVVGPFDNENKGGYDVVHGPEEAFDLSGSYPGLRSEVSWRAIDGLGRTGPIVLHEAIRPTDGVLVYAAVVLDAPAATSAVIHMGTPGAAKAWLNGRAIFADPSYHPARFDQRAIPVRLERGKNPLLLKLASGGAGPFQLELRVVGEDGQPIRGLVARAPIEGSWKAVERIAAGRVILGRRTLVDTLAGLAKGGSARALEDYARVLDARRSFDDADRLHAIAAAKAAHAADDRVEVQLLAARTHGDDANERRIFLERAVAAELPGSAKAHAARASFFLSQGDVQHALELLGPWLRRAPGDWSGGAAWAQALDGRGESASAIRTLDELIARFPDQPSLLRQRARLHHRDGQNDDVIRLLRVALAHRPADLEVALSLASALVARGDILGADELLVAAERLQPLHLGLLLRRADLLAANGDIKRARVLYDQAATLAPQEGDVFESLGRAELRGGDEAAALVAFERSLEVRPQNARLRELVQSLRPGDERFAKAYLRDLSGVVASAEGRFPDEDALKLVQVSAVRVMPSGQSSRTVQTIVQVRNQRGVERYRSFQVQYAPERQELKVERARILRADGTVVYAHTENDRSMNEPWSGLYYDARATVIGFPSLAAGDTVELVYRLDDVAGDNLLSDYFGDIDFIADTVATLDWEYVLEMPAGRTIHANETPIATRSDATLTGGRRLHRWAAQDIDKLVPEPHMPGWVEVASHLHVSTYRDWESVGRYWWGLVQDQVAPTPEVERTAREVVAGIPASDEAARVRAIYDFVATKTRYVGLEFGIHSFKPYRVEQVLRRGFGDCKDKASLTWSLLRSIGIDSRLVLLRMRHLGQIGPSPASLAVFNHAILYVPSLDLYLDGTAEWSGSRELPESDRGAEVLVVDPNGGSEFRVTPEAPASLSVTSNRHRVELGADGKATMIGSRTVSGLAAPGYRQTYASASGRVASFEQSWARSFPGATVSSFELSDPRRLEQDVKLDFELAIPGFADVALDGSLSFAPTRSAGSLVESFAALSSRRYDVVIRYPWTTEFSYDIQLPEGYVPASLPESSQLESRFGTIRLAYTAEGGRLLVEGAVALSSSRIHPGEYADFRAFLGQVDSLLSRKVLARPGR